MPTPRSVSSRAFNVQRLFNRLRVDGRLVVLCRGDARQRPKLPNGSLVGSPAAEANQIKPDWKPRAREFQCWIAVLGRGSGPWSACRKRGPGPGTLRWIAEPVGLSHATLS